MPIILEMGRESVPGMAEEGLLVDAAENLIAEAMETQVALYGL